MSDTEQGDVCAPIPVPACMSAALAGYRWARDVIGESDGAVYRLHGEAGASDLFLKHGEGVVADEITDEMARLRWLAGYLPTPAVLQFVRTSDEAWLLMTAVPGKMAIQVMEARPDIRDAVVDAIAAFLRRLHAIPVAECPFDSDRAYRLIQARKRIDTGRVDVDDFDDEREGWTVEQVWKTMLDLPPFEPDPVVTHGDFTLDNLLIREGEVTGCIDTGRLGVADRYQDLAILWNGLGHFGPLLQARFLQQYGIAEMNWDKLRFHLMLDEFF
ncbi:APH(3')-I family aminoglycoside O-phosphotransferase [Marilutibacter maris]|nr:APH(3')-I family aminoglycoside O-phosphotransferase [Lysobacter maris]